MANFEPLGPRKWSNNNFGSLESTVLNPQNLDKQLNANSFSIGSCLKCGYPGHLAYQCRNTIPLCSNKQIKLAISSTSSESEYETPLKQLKSDYKKEKREKKIIKKLKKKRHKRDSSSSTSSKLSTFENDQHKKQKHLKKSKDKHKKLKKRKHKKHKHKDSSSLN